jgi:O-antigen/teichoic acid export membrane protein
MSKMIRRSRGTVLLFPARLAEKICYFIVTLLISRSFSVSDYGQFSFAIYFGFSIAVLAEFGLQTVVTRDLVAYPARQRELFGTALILKIPLSLAALLIIGAINLLTELGHEQAILLWIIGLGQIAVTIGYLGNAVFRATQRLEIESLSTLARGMLYLVATIVALLNDLPLLGIAWFILLANSVSTMLLLILACRIIRPICPHALVDKILSMLNQATPLALSLVATAAFSTLSTVVLRLSMHDTLIGWYNSANALTANLFFLPDVVMAALLPPMITALQKDNLNRRPLTESLVIMVLLSLPISLSIFMFAPRILSFIFGGKFATAAVALRWLIWTLPLYYVNFAYMMFFSARRQQHLWLLFVLLGILVTALALIILLPVFGMEGAAMSRLVGEITVFVLGTLRARTSVDKSRLIFSTVRIGAALAGLAIVVWISRSTPLFFLAGLGAITYAALVISFGPWSVSTWADAITRVTQ